ncbi:MAG: hypothetical protein ABIN48_07970 [Ginsengibacter sp.]
MQNFKNKLYHFETPPPEDLWSKISGELDDQKVVRIKGIRGKSKLLYYSLTAAAALLIIFASNQFLNKDVSELSTEKNSQNSYFSSASADSINQNYELLKKIINSPKGKKTISSNTAISDGFTKKYITIAGPDGQPVNISMKAATLILSADKEYPPNPIWNEKIDKWQQFMLSNTFPPTSAGLLDMIESAGNME